MPAYMPALPEFSPDAAGSGGRQRQRLAAVAGGLAGEPTVRRGWDSVLCRSGFGLMLLTRRRARRSRLARDALRYADAKLA